MSRYALTGQKGYFAEISSEDFNLLRDARNHLFEALSIEEKLNLVLENYAEFEQDLFQCSVNDMLFNIHDWSSGIDVIHTMNRRIVNLLTTGRLYVDQVHHNVRSIYGAGSEYEEAFKNLKSQEYDSIFPGYRIMEALRNYVQHRELPISRLHTDTQKIKNESKMLVKHLVKLYIDTNTLGEDSKFKKAILTELQGLGASVEFTPLVRQYVESVGKIHIEIRNILRTDILIWEKQVQNTLSQYQAITNVVGGLSAVSMEESVTTETIPIFEDPIKRRQMLESKNKNITNCSSHFISSEAPEIQLN